MIETIQLVRAVPRAFAGMPMSSQVWDQDFTFRRGETYMVEAASGTGKTSLCAYITGERRDYSGTILLGGRDAREISAEGWAELRRRALALVPQELRLFPELTAMDNLRVKNRLSGLRSEAEMLGMLATLGIADKADTPVSRMSAGQRQRVAIARALCQEADFIILDEPASHLDAECNRAAGALVLAHARRMGSAIIVTSVGARLTLDTPSINVKL